MPMIDVYAPADVRGPARSRRGSLAVRSWRSRECPILRCSLEKTARSFASFRDGISDVNGWSAHVRVQVLTNAGALDREKQLAIVARPPR